MMPKVEKAIRIIIGGASCFTLPKTCSVCYYGFSCFILNLSYRSSSVCWLSNGGGLPSFFL